MEGDEYTFYKHREGDSFFLCIECPGPKLEEYQLDDAMRFLREHGFIVSKPNKKSESE